MIKKFVLAFAILALVAAFAGTVPAGGSNYRITLLQPSVVKGIELKPGEYRINVLNEKATFILGKVSVEAPVKVESVEKKFDSTAIRYTAQPDGKSSISEIRVGGTKTRLLFN